MLSRGHLHMVICIDEVIWPSVRLVLSLDAWSSAAAYRDMRRVMCRAPNSSISACSARVGECASFRHKLSLAWFPQISNSPLVQVVLPPCYASLPPFLPPFVASRLRAGEFAPRRRYPDPGPASAVSAAHRVRGVSGECSGCKQGWDIGGPAFTWIAIEVQCGELVGGNRARGRRNA